MYFVLFNIILIFFSSPSVRIGFAILFIISTSVRVLIFPLLFTSLSLWFCSWYKFFEKNHFDLVKWFDLCVW